MGWLGTAWIGAVIGGLGWRWHPARGLFKLWLSVAACAAGACLAKLAGNLSGLFYDGQSLEWLTSVLVAVIVVALLGRAATRRGARP